MLCLGVEQLFEHISLTISVNLAHHELFRAKVGKGGIHNYALLVKV